MTDNLRQVSLLFLIKDDNILLAMKKRGFGAGRWNGVGGKPDIGEAIEQTAVRECQEEIGVTPLDLKHVATLDFHFPIDKSDFDMQAVVYSCSKWQGEPTETEEMQPAWYKFADIPYDKMWADDKYWLPTVLGGKFVTANFTFDDNDSVANYTVS
ncbi:MAG: 8-oxo-dGTP diphosphatase [Candidatus Saccharimonadales bacterium]